MKIHIDIELIPGEGEKAFLRSLAERLLHTAAQPRTVWENPFPGVKDPFHELPLKGDTPAQSPGYAKGDRAAVPESAHEPAPAPESEGTPAVAEETPQVPTVSDDDLVTHTNILMKKFTGLDDSRASDDPKVRATVRQCGAVFKEIARHFGAPRPTALPQRKRLDFIKALDSVYLEGETIVWKPF